MSDFINHNFILQSDIEEQLYHNYAKDLPIIDYHNHLPPDQISNNHQFDNLLKFGSLVTITNGVLCELWELKRNILQEKLLILKNFKNGRRLCLKH